jgi:cbb3-type cytochrome oxidase cytochrome c subunit
MVNLGVPYTEDEVTSAAELARSQAEQMVAEVLQQDGPDAVPSGLEATKMIALVAYLQRLGKDSSATIETTEQQVATVKTAESGEVRP